MANVPGPAICATCGRDLPAQVGRGRQRRYCDATCRSAARRGRTRVSAQHVNERLTTDSRKVTVDAGPGGQRLDDLAERVLTAAGHLADPGGGSAPLDRVAAARDLARTADEALRAAVDTARADGHTWQEVGDVLGTSRQAAFQRFGRPVGEPATTTMTDAADRAVALLADYVEGRYEEVRARFDDPMAAELDGAALGEVWARVAGLVGRYEGTGEPFAHTVGALTAVDVPLRFEAGDMSARVTLRADGRVAGLFVRPTGPVVVREP